jgi:hypothetical protein
MKKKTKKCPLYGKASKSDKKQFCLNNKHTQLKKKEQLRFTTTTTTSLCKNNGLTPKPLRCRRPLQQQQQRKKKKKKNKRKNASMRYSPPRDTETWKISKLF